MYIRNQAVSNIVIMTLNDLWSLWVIHSIKSVS